MTTPAKTEDQIAREKDAVLKMVGAKSAMEVALQRISRLEEELRYVVKRIETVDAAFSENTFIQAWVDGAHKPVSIKTHFSDTLAHIRKVL